MFGPRWQHLTQLEVSDTAIKVAFADPIATPAAPAAAATPVSTQPKELPEPALNDADLALSPPAGMLAPYTPPEEQN